MALGSCPDADDSHQMGTDAHREEWIVCGGRTRSVLAGEIHCPMRGQIGQSVCLDCRHLMATSAERASASWCALPEPEMLGGVERDWAAKRGPSESAPCPAPSLWMASPAGGA
jgi:hypothetical protein